MSEGSDSVVEITLAQSHRFAEILIICQELPGAKTNRARLRCCSRRHFEHVGVRVHQWFQILQLSGFEPGVRGDNAKVCSTKLLDSASAVSRDLEFQRQKRSTATPGSNHDGRPLHTISNLEAYRS